VIRMTPTVCVFNRTRESFLCMNAIAAGALPVLPPYVSGMGPWFRLGIDEEFGKGFSEIAREDGIWLMPSPGDYIVGTLLPVDRVYLDQGNRVIQLIEHLDPLQIVPMRYRPASVLEVRTRTIYSSRTRVGDELLICPAEEVETHWKRIEESSQERSRVQMAWTKEEVIPCSKG
jgi:hypothetical protein